MKKLLLVILFILCITGVSQSQWFESGDGGLGDLDTTRIAFFDKDGTFAGTMTFTDSIIVVDLKGTNINITRTATIDSLILTALIGNVTITGDISSVDTITANALTVNKTATLDSLVVTTIATIGKTLDVTGTSTYGINTNKLQVDTLLEGDGENGISTNATFKPTGDDQCDLGSSALAWRDIHTNDAFIQDSLTAVSGVFSGNIKGDSIHVNKLVLDNGTELVIGTNNTDRWYFDANGDQLPILTSTYKIGSSTNEVKRIYADSVEADDINADTIQAEQVYWELIHGFTYVEDGADSLTLTTKDTYYKLTPGFVTDSVEIGIYFDGITFTGDSLTIITPGDYWMTFSFTISSGTNAEDYKVAFFKNDVKVYGIRRTYTNGNYSGGTIPFYFPDLVAGDDICVKVTNLSNNTDVVVFSNLNWYVEMKPEK